MVLGQVLERLGDETFAAETMVALDDLKLMIQVEAAGRPFGEGVGEYAAGASRRFAQLASDEDWLALMTALETPPYLDTAAVISGDAARSPASAKGSRARQILLAFRCCLLLLLLSENTSAAAVAAAAGARNLSRAANPAHPKARAFKASWTMQHELERSPPTRAMRSDGGEGGEG